MSRSLRCWIAVLLSALLATMLAQSAVATATDAAGYDHDGSVSSAFELRWLTAEPSEPADGTGADRATGADARPRPAVELSAPSGIPGATRLSAAEQATAGRLQQVREFAGRTFSESPHVGAEYIDDLGRSFDAMGTPQASQYWNESQFLRSVDSHLLKSNDFTVIDLTGFRSEQIATVRNYVNGLPAADQARIVRIGF